MGKIKLQLNSNYYRRTNTTYIIGSRSIFVRRAILRKATYPCCY